MLRDAICVFVCSFQGSPSEDRNFRSDVDDTETEEASVSGQEDPSDVIDILEWAKVQMRHFEICLFTCFNVVCLTILGLLLRVEFPCFSGKQQWVITDNM